MGSSLSLEPLVLENLRGPDIIRASLEDCT